MLVASPNLNAYSLQAHRNEELKSLTLYRFDKVAQLSKLKQSLLRLLTILFPELESAISSLHSDSALLLKYPGDTDVAKSQLHSFGEHIARQNWRRQS